jgi:hypothetical protein
MSSERVDCRRKADDARQRAAQASEPFMRSAYEKVAEHWMLLARQSLSSATKKLTKTLSKPGPSTMRGQSATRVRFLPRLDLAAAIS